MKKILIFLIFLNFYLFADYIIYSNGSPTDVPVPFNGGCYILDHTGDSCFDVQHNYWGTVLRGSDQSKITNPGMVYTRCGSYKVRNTYMVLDTNSVYNKNNNSCSENPCAPGEHYDSTVNTCLKDIDNHDCKQDGTFDPLDYVSPGWVYYADTPYIDSCKNMVTNHPDLYSDYTELAFSCDSTGSSYCYLKLVCPQGQITNDSGQCCDVGNADVQYNVDQATCESTTLVKIDDLTLLTNLTWNSCLNKCIAVSNSCPKDKVFDANGYCVPAVINPTECQAQGGTLQNFRTDHADTCIENGGNVIAPCCQYVADCIDNNGNILSTPSVYVSCGDNNSTMDSNATTDLNTSDGDGYVPTLCQNCPPQYPIQNSAGNCENGQGDIYMCPNTNDDNGTTNLSCGTCGTLGESWMPALNGWCKHTTANGIVQYAGCPTADSSDNSGNTNVDINTTADSNSTFTDQNSSNTDIPTSVCPCCPAGYRSIGGLCGMTNSTGQIVAYVPCPCAVVNQNEGNGTGDINGTGDGNTTGDDNGSKLGNRLGNMIKDEIKKAYKNYSFFNTSDCGTLQISESAYLFGEEEAEIRDPLPAFIDILTPYRNIIKGFLMFIAIIIGLFDFFKRS